MVFNVSSKLQCILHCFANAEFSCLRGNYFANAERCELFQFWNATYETLLLNFADDCQGFEKKNLCPFDYTFLPEESVCIRWFTEVGSVSWDVAHSQYCTSQGPIISLQGYSNCSALRKCVWTGGYRFNDNIAYWRYANNVTEKFGATMPWNNGEPTYYSGDNAENCIELLENGRIHEKTILSVISSRFFEEVYSNLHSENPVDIIYLDFATYQEATCMLLKTRSGVAKIYKKIFY
ncbi:hypothetical protein HELRODRAFT_179271 [Helobdella robusta]|uniref:C-type lectin domain-containing protein n=1 Tax=Helobdella robusta TaxID=6412 RepID=T1FEG5_HELRO|nr:hypothetical protein HELRODRAFT_179271 [Helobdella robusta]ESN95497.1 hypothetical protein HELRODRAFT_179271 [Helobdella robusta]